MTTLVTRRGTLTTVCANLIDGDLVGVFGAEVRRRVRGVKEASEQVRIQSPFDHCRVGQVGVANDVAGAGNNLGVQGYRDLPLWVGHDPNGTAAQRRLAQAGSGCGARRAYRAPVLKLGLAGDLGNYDRA